LRLADAATNLKHEVYLFWMGQDRTRTIFEETSRLTCIGIYTYAAAAKNDDLPGALNTRHLAEMYGENARYVYLALSAWH